MASNIIQIITIIENLASENILLVDANLYILPYIDAKLKGRGEEYIYRLIETLNEKAGKSLVVFFVQGNSQNNGKYLMNELSKITELLGNIDIDRLNYLWYDLALIESFTSFRRKIQSEYQLWNDNQRKFFDSEAKQFVDHAIDYVYRYFISKTKVE